MRLTTCHPRCASLAFRYLFVADHAWVRFHVCQPQHFKKLAEHGFYGTDTDHFYKGWGREGRGDAEQQLLRMNESILGIEQALQDFAPVHGESRHSLTPTTFD